MSKVVQCHHICNNNYAGRDFLILPIAIRGWKNQDVLSFTMAKGIAPIFKRPRQMSL